MHDEPAFVALGFKSNRRGLPLEHVRVATVLMTLSPILMSPLPLEHARVATPARQCLKKRRLPLEHVRVATAPVQVPQQTHWRVTA